MHGETHEVKGSDKIKTLLIKKSAQQVIISVKYTIQNTSLSNTCLAWFSYYFATALVSF